MLSIYIFLMWLLGVLTGILINQKYSYERKLLKECLEAMEKAQENYGYDDSICEILDPSIKNIYEHFGLYDEDEDLNHEKDTKF